MADSHPGYTGTRRSSGGSRSGTGGGDQTTLSGQYPPTADHGIFGGPLPTGTGAPGSGGGAGDGDDTTEAGQLTDDFSSASTSDVTNTGAPGSGGARPSTGGGTGVTFTEPGSYLSGTYEQDRVSGDVDGPGEWTEANASGYGTSGPKLPGMKEPTSTGAGKGSVMRGGRPSRG